MIGDAVAMLATDKEGVQACGFSGFPEAGDLLADLLEALEAKDGIASLHFENGNDPLLLHCFGQVASDPALTGAVMRHAAELCRYGAGSGREITANPLGPAFSELEALTVSFPCQESRTCLTVTALVARKEEARRPLRFAMLRRLTPMLGAAFKLWQQLRVQTQERRGLAVALDAVEFGIILVDREGEVGFANATARSMLAEGRFLRKRGGVLCASQLRDTMKVQAALAAAIAANAGEGPADPQGSEAGLLQITADGGRVVVAAIPAEHPAHAPGAVAAMLVVHNPDRRYERLVAPVCKLFGMSAVETRLAIHLVAGHSLAEASSLMRIKEQTARGYLKQVFLKANVKRQADLVRLLLSSLLNTRMRSALHAV